MQTNDDRKKLQDDSLVKHAVSDTSLDEQRFEVPKEPCTIAIFGATGDLASRKLLPALYGLYMQGGLPHSFVIVGCARTNMNTEEFRTRIHKALTQSGKLDMADWDEFASRLHYQHVMYDEVDTYHALAKRLDALDQEFGAQGNRLFYLAVPPTVYKIISQMLGKAGLSREGEAGIGWSRVIVEKPFGSDLKTAVDLKDAMHASFQESQIFRIDHYLAKETVQNVLVLRFANAIFEPLWNRMFIDHVRITAAENLGVENRAGYYEQAGVLRDMFQNHMMQLLGLIAMEPPDRFEDEHVRDEKVKVFRSLRPFPLESVRERLILAQYAEGRINGETVPAYRAEPGVNPESLTPTFAMMKVFVDNWRWQGVPFYIVSGKRMSRKLTEISIQFKMVPHSMFRSTLGDRISPNRLTLGIFPDEKIKLTFQTKNPGIQSYLRSVTMDFDYMHGLSGPVLDSYEKALLDAIVGDHMLFWRQDSVEACWSFLDPVIEDCETCYDRVKQLEFYESGSWGPKSAEDLIGSGGTASG
jgi:glucose-6-phosphate 1-dehydrogenase